MSLSYWDIILIVAVTAQATVFAYVYTPRAKALVYSLPIPFTFALLTLGRPVDATNVAGLVILLGYTHGVRLLHYRLRLPILVAIPLAVLGYVTTGWWLATWLPGSEAAFWVSVAAVLGLGALSWWATPDHVEQGSRTTLPLPVKVPLIAIVVIALVLLKSGLHGFMTTFPMVGVIGAYEARRCLWAMCRQIPVILLSLTPMMVVLHLTQRRLGLPLSLALGWTLLLLLLAAMTRAGMARERRVAAELAAAQASTVGAPATVLALEPVAPIPETVV